MWYFRIVDMNRMVWVRVKTGAEYELKNSINTTSLNFVYSNTTPTTNPTPTNQLISDPPLHLRSDPCR